MLQDFVIVALAALVGYGTNWLAVKMLFRPHRAVRLWGRRVPFTPGMIPARRDEIVEAIADGVGQRLLTPEVIERELAGVDLVGPIERYVRQLVAELAEGPVIKETARRQVALAADSMAASPELQEALTRRIKPGLAAALGGAAAGGTWLITSLPGARLLPRKTVAAVAAGAAALLADRFCDDISARLTRGAADAVRRATADGMVDDAARDALQRLPDTLFDPDGTMRASLEQGLRDAIPEAARSVDIRAMVQRRLATFDVADLEALILSASRKHLRAITVVGGVLGALVGLLQVALRHVWG